jgi:hypothetical protein
MRHTSVFTTLAYMSYKQEEIDRAICELKQSHWGFRGFSQTRLLFL